MPQVLTLIEWKKNVELCEEYDQCSVSMIIIETCVDHRDSNDDEVMWTDSSNGAHHDLGDCEEDVEWMRI